MIVVHLYVCHVWLRRGCMSENEPKPRTKCFVSPGASDRFGQGCVIVHLRVTYSEVLQLKLGHLHPTSYLKEIDAGNRKTGPFQWPSQSQLNIVCFVFKLSMSTVTLMRPMTYWKKDKFAIFPPQILTCCVQYGHVIEVSDAVNRVPWATLCPPPVWNNILGCCCHGRQRLVNDFLCKCECCCSRCKWKTQIMVLGCSSGFSCHNRVCRAS